MASIRIDSPAKVNLVLEVLGRRADGYHDVATVYQAVDWSDTIIIRTSRADSGIRLSCNWSELNTCDNLCMRAARLAAERWDRAPNLHIELRKQIPYGAGLGGGSSNAAAVLLALRELWDVSVPLDELVGLGARLGADVPFFFYGGTAIGQGTGTDLCPVSLGPIRPMFLIVKPRVHVNTGEAYRRLNIGEKRPAVRLNRFLGETPFSTLEALGQTLYNDFETVVLQTYPEIGYIKGVLDRWSSLGSLLCGSGSSVLALCDQGDLTPPTLLPAPVVVRYVKAIDQGVCIRE